MGAVLVETVPEYEFRGGLFYVVESDGTKRVYRPNTFFAAIAAATATGREFKFGSAEVIPFPDKDEASSA